jgi:chromosome partitioning protein
VVKPYEINPYVHIIPGSADLLKLEYQLHESVRSDSILKEILTPIKKSYDLILLDCPPSFNIFTINALTCSNLILAPAKPEVFSVNGIEFLEQFAVKHDIPFKIIFNQINMQSLLHKRIIEKVTKDYNGNLLTNSIRNSIALAEAFESAQDIFNYKGNSTAASDFVNLADELIPYI